MPAGLRDVATNDVSSLGLEDCPAGVVPAPTGLGASLAEGIFTLTWDAVTGAGLYEAQHTTDAADAASVTWTALEAVTATSQTYTPEDSSPCSVAYRFRVRARGDGMTRGGQLGRPVGGPRAHAQLSPGVHRRSLRLRGCGGRGGGRRRGYGLGHGPGRRRRLRLPLVFLTSDLMSGGHYMQTDPLPLIPSGVTRNQA